MANATDCVILVSRSGGRLADRFARRVDQETGITFVFKYDPEAPELLHIFVRHATTTEEAILTFKQGDAVWNDRHQRFESQTRTHGLLWFWRIPGRVVMVISCYRKDIETWISR